MNIVEAWKLAKDGQEIKRPQDIKNECFIVKESSGCDQHCFSKTIFGVCDRWIVADDWEIVKEHKKVETTLGDWKMTPCYRRYPDDAKITIEWDE